jgi:hypothetical protein
MKKFARIIGEKLNRLKGPTCVLIPKKGGAEADKFGTELFNQETDQIFVEELRRIIPSKIPIEGKRLRVDKGISRWKHRMLYSKPIEKIAVSSFGSLLTRIRRFYPAGYRETEASLPLLVTPIPVFRVNLIPLAVQLTPESFFNAFVLRRAAS